MLKYGKFFPWQQQKLCRMLAIFPMDGHRASSESIRSFRRLASQGMVCPGAKPGHGDGWGMVSWVDGTPRYLGREPSNALTDERFEEACEAVDTSRAISPILVHLRKASAALKTRENTHPFVIDRWAFAHNGAIRKLNLKVRTDSEWFFESLMRKYREMGNDMYGAISEQVSEVREIYPYTSITFILSDGRELFAYRDCTKNQPYYDVQYTRLNSSIIVSQEPFFESRWIGIRNAELLHLREDGALETTTICDRPSFSGL